MLLVAPAPARAPANTQTTNAPPTRRAAAPAAPWTLPSAPRAASIKEHQTSAAAVCDAGKVLLSHVIDRHVQTCIFFYNPDPFAIFPFFYL